ncbi:bifunctional proline dehydrogenase/L-glutamate gamma-semialdehyde dehydrogenase PutA [Kangiella sediminilitoris]|uniref:Bifunctional protein PutA n=1 Tax=Kangiella sediminilitoris TaxID=1144748 RepID=A0A1B3B8R3_9GAMM|nr:bifunctional proline dehydrogenase/L-glutamate gamma-semialdehyde dehydrogenase PutA [Kangiella sediminilitoris]AOE49160.1 pyrroline-5-carboxylate dehydrogenase [Kangiella sediminilitoris]
MLRASQIFSDNYKDLPLDQWQTLITQNYAVDESDYLNELLALATPDKDTIEKVTRQASDLVEAIRQDERSKEGVEAFLQQYSLSTKEGIILMCLAEALLRIPDAKVANDLIRDKLTSADWEKHTGQSSSYFVNASTWGLMLTGKIIDVDQDGDGKPDTMLRGLIAKFGEPVIRQAMNQAMRIMGRQFVLGRTIKEALKRGAKSVQKGYTHSFDMLGEAAYTAKDAQRYYEAYSNAIAEIGAVKVQEGNEAPSISIKLSALHPRYEEGQRDRILTEMVGTVSKLVKQARDLDVAVTIDAEEADRLEISLDVFEAVYDSTVCDDWEGFGMVVQAYSKRALPVLGWLNALSKKHGRRIPLRLVKGAYWDSEIKWSQQGGYSSYPVFTRKCGTDVSYLACANYLLNADGKFYPQFATHNAQTVFSIMNMAGTSRDFEFQRLHGMGEALYDMVLNQYPDLHCRIYAPVGNHKDLLPYLVRRLLENGANTSFVHQLVDEKTPVMELAEHPSTVLKSFETLHNDRIPLPPHIYEDFGEMRLNSSGTNLHIQSETEPFMNQVKHYLDNQWHAKPIIDGQEFTSEEEQVICPYDHSHTVGTVHKATEEQALKALDVAHQNFIGWDVTPVQQRSALLDKVADTLESHKHELIALCSRDGGKSIQDGIDEVREAIDFCRYYAYNARNQFGHEIHLPGPTGESNDLYLQGRGVFACISPWNFPLAIFIGQVAAALVAGNTVIAKPADQTTLVAYRAVQLMHEAGIPTSVLQFVPIRGSVLGKVILSDNRIGGVAFTGSTSTAHTINRTLASRDAMLSPLIAETGGQNAMIVDSSALPEQVVEDVIHSAFTSAGQRCSALRVLYLQEEIADKIIEVLSGAMQELRLGNPTDLSTDVGPVIDMAAREELQEHIDELKAAGKLIAETPMPEGLEGHGSFLSPVAFEINHINDLEQEWFGPIVHIVRYKAKDLDKVIDQINNYGFGLTLGVHSRNESTALYIDKRARVGNVYINRNMIGATVGVQPFGGQGLSGTGPKAGGPFYLYRFATEHTRTNNTAAIGGNASLLSLGDEDVSPEFLQQEQDS